MTGNPLGLAFLAVVGLGLLGLLGWASFCFTRWYRADAETRISLRQARRLRWGWNRLAPMLGLAVKDATPTVLQQYGPQEQPAKPRGWSRDCAPAPTPSASPSPPMPCRR
ncbi:MULTISPECIES: hypothetical protein [Streptomyces]|uniref:Uncharacterized protein n=2 Tax=Streptomyces koyangensis TaxID=188770 RepID=A0A385DHE0_9ACTN|nr:MULTISPECIES: hypothetical protein [Streptomyces]AXQ57211.1 hypothetical protein D0C37_23165 [Streptomyces koyangensis]NEE34871.1 hypothetical protein [Streptomyces sp. SID7982]NEE56267.1 hypothetical protein [Streptomyces sp. SID8455]WTD02739.1 hypothetical protein OH717_09250 [Streptomyces albidoflavus]